MQINKFNDWLLRARTAHAMIAHGWTIMEVARNLSVTDSCVSDDLRRLLGLKSVPYQRDLILGTLGPHECPRCGERMRVFDTRKMRTHIRRRRVCERCGHRTTTREVVIGGG